MFPPTSDQIASVLNKALDEYFPAGSGVRIIAEPGRYFVASAFTLAVNIIAKRTVARDIADTDGELHDRLLGLLVWLMGLLMITGPWGLIGMLTNRVILICLQSFN